MSDIDEYIRKAERKFKVGEELLKIGYYSESIDNFYYSMYSIAKALLFKKNFTPRSHSGTINLLYIHYVEIGELDKELHKGFASAQTIREEVDYGFNDEYDEDEAQEKRDICERFIKEGKKILGE